MVKWIKNFLKAITTKEEKYHGPKCTYCGSIDFFEGPSGGATTNILCANQECGHWFNWAGAFGGLEDLGFTQAEREKRRNQLNPIIHLKEKT